MTFTLPEIIARMNWIGAQTDETRARLRDGCERTRHVPTGERLMTNPPIDTCWVCGQEFREGRAATEAEQ